MAVERFLSAAEQIASPSSSPERTDEARHLFYVVHEKNKNVTRGCKHGRKVVRGRRVMACILSIGGGTDSTKDTPAV